MINFSELTKQNPWWENPASIDADPKIRDFEEAPLKWRPRIRKYIDLEKDVLYSLRGPRQVGKTTFVKLTIREELKKRNPVDIFYYTCDLVSGPVELKEIIEQFLDWSLRQSTGRKLICLDEVTRVSNWENAYKQVVDLRSLKGITYVLTGSSSWDLKHGVERLPGRKGESLVQQNHKILLPLKFAEYVELRSPAVHKAIEKLKLNDNSVRTTAFFDLMRDKSKGWIYPLLPFKKEIDSLFQEYLLTGGVMTAANQYYSKKEISNTTYELYLQMFFGDLARLKREESTAKKVLSSVLRHPQSHVGWQRISTETGLPSVITIQNYADVLQNLFVLNVYSAFDQNKRQPKHRSEKKLQIPNPFFFHAFRGYIENPAGDYFREAKSFLLRNEGVAALAEFITGDHMARMAYNHRPSDLFDQSNSVFYVKNAAGETIDFIIRLPGGFVPVEVKYQNSISSSDYRNLKKFNRGILATKETLNLEGAYPAIPVPLLLLFV
ncbi:MAG: ATP-binding protein [Candidatus Diapherotrites archaeon]|uniref:ATP-binding protein n=1 Tax=Candidatus Iainarchaeum sp. TaxID=3101447 RepID=A0A8T3YNC9_9ARCH|nr:ATP-binding protein [Candidatus Diapherotrites archaeon]